MFALLLLAIIVGVMLLTWLAIVVVGAVWDWSDARRRNRAFDRMVSGRGDYRDLLDLL